MKGLTLNSILMTQVVPEIATRLANELHYTFHFPVKGEWDLVPFKDEDQDRVDYIHSILTPYGVTLEEIAPLVRNFALTKVRAEIKKVKADRHETVHSLVHYHDLYREMSDMIEENSPLSYPERQLICRGLPLEEEEEIDDIVTELCHQRDWHGY